MSQTAPIDAFVPDSLRDLSDPSRELPRLAKSRSAMAAIEAAVVEVPTRHRVVLGDARLADLAAESVHLVVTSPPYWILKEYRRADGQLGWVEDYEEFLRQIDQVWRKCHAALVPGGRLICVVGDVCLARRRNRGKHTVVPGIRFLIRSTAPPPPRSPRPPAAETALGSRSTPCTSRMVSTVCAGTAAVS